MWFLGAVLGALLAGKLDSGLWLVGAILGGVLGWSLGSRARQRQEERFRLLEERLQALEGSVALLSRSPPSLAADIQPSAAAAPAAAAPAAAVDQTRCAGDVGAVAGEPSLAAATLTSPPPAAAALAAARQAAAPSAEAVPPTGPAVQGAASATPVSTTGWAAASVDRLLRGNLMARAGVIVLFFGVAFLLKYGYQHLQVPIELRLTGVALAAVVLLLLGWRLRATREAYALALQGGAIGLLYLTIFGALRLFGLLDAAPAFVMLLAVAALAAMLAVLQDAVVLAVLGAVGGFLAPIIAATGVGSHVTLFAYYGVLNIGILAIAVFKAWRLLNLVGFVFTFAIATFWGALRYRPEHFASSEPFLILFFLIYAAMPVLFALRAGGPRANRLDTTLVFALPLIAFGLQVALVREFAYGSACSALALGAFYLLLARALWSRLGEEQRLLVEAFLALGVGFTTLAIPLAFDGRWTAAAWAIEGAALVWVGVRQQRLPARLFGILLQLLAGLFQLGELPDHPGAWPLLNSAFLGGVLLTLAGLFCAWLLQREWQREPRQLRTAERVLAPLLFLWGVAWWSGSGLHEIDRFLPPPLRVNAAILFFTASCLLFSALDRRLGWPAARHAALALLPLLFLLAGVAAGHTTHPFADLGYLAWPLAFAAHFRLLYRYEADRSWPMDWLHGAGLWLLAAIGACELAWNIDRWVDGRASWTLLGWALWPGALLAALALRGERLRWPVAAHRAAYFVRGGTPLAIFLGLWFLAGNVLSDGDPRPLPYLPLFNPLDLAQAGVVLLLATWFGEARRLRLPPYATASLPLAWGVLGVAAFLWANAVLLRALHHWAGIPLSLAVMLRSELVQASLSLFWTLLALAVMLLATRRLWRALWLAGAGLMAVVVGKLLLVDLSNAGTIERIVSFLGVGLLMLVIGYLAPAPPKGDAP
ncbi:DUF2339 domain-containing protein [Accumulibacter sp.]|uniref:DUF2339 domain-containing protein n=1 Tax=Accumulibacter sp. TaxID=2053492 RepID=UPI0025D10FB9|nr:DUF2339 domain-containing protein [Accumulibacter sp.]MCM8611388.1 DUF2339 domain-containing protein [Accumulibacter sp.]MCM8634965.1 DUF2339 domain-containing protein [Accumulibacter sp.]MCM8639753.1 DUF2339 domain-containing protein [Accumulibacter sp.]